MRYLIILLFLVGCSSKTNHAVKNGEFYFKNAAKVDNESIGPRMHRSENDEVICYTACENGCGISCTWKVKQ